MTDAALSKEEVTAAKAADDKTAADAKAATKAAAATAKREAYERVATKAHLAEILSLRGIARSLSPHGSEDLAGALDNIANQLASGRKLDEQVLVDVAIALKNADRHWGGMVEKINDLMKPAAVTDRSVVGILRAVESGNVTVDQGQALLRQASTPPAPKPAPVEHPVVLE